MTRKTAKSASTTTTKTRTKKSKFNKAGHRSGLETTVATKLTELGLKFEYESEVLPYTMPVVHRKYTPDFVIKKGKQKIYLEVKGKLDRDTRKKMVEVITQHPKLRFVMCFGKPENAIYKGSKTTYRKWAIDNGFEVCDPTTLGEIL